MAPSTLTLPSISQLYGLSEDNLLAYEAEGLISPLRVGKDRYYTPQDCLKIEVILKGKKLGFSLREVKQILEAHSPASATIKLDIDRTRKQIAQLEDERDALQMTIDRLRASIEE